MGVIFLCTKATDSGTKSDWYMAQLLQESYWRKKRQNGPKNVAWKLYICTRYPVLHKVLSYIIRFLHTCEPPDRRTNSPVFVGHLPISNLLTFTCFSRILLTFLHVHVPNVQFAPCAFRPRKQDATCGILNPLHSAEVFYSHFKICFNNFIYPPWVDYFTLGWRLFEYLLASTVNFKIIFLK